MAQDSPQETKKKRVPTSITSIRMEVDHKTNVVVFIGDVVAVKGDLTVKSDRMEVYNNRETGAMERMIATGNVRIEKGGEYAKSERAVFNESEGTVVLTGNPEVWDAENRVRGDKMTMFLEEDKSVVTGKEDKRVHAVFYPQGAEEAGTGADSGPETVLTGDDSPQVGEKGGAPK